MSIFERKIKVNISIHDPIIKAVNWPKQSHYIELSEKAIMQRRDYIKMPKSDYDEMMSYLKIYNSLEETASNNNNGILAEKEGRIDDAIRIYENSILDEYPATHSYDRLMILYRKRKDYDNEIRVIKIAIRVFEKERMERDRLGVGSDNIAQEVNRYKLRLEKAEALMAKASQVK